MGAPRFVECAQVKTIDTPRVRVLGGTELKRRQAAVELFEVALKKGERATRGGRGGRGSRLIRLSAGREAEGVRRVYLDSVLEVCLLTVCSR